MKLNIFHYWLPSPPKDHEVYFYVSDQELIPELIDYLSSGMDADNSCIIIAKPLHIKQLHQGLTRNSPEKGKAFAEKCIVINADVLLEELMVNCKPNKQRFLSTIGHLIEVAAAEGKPVRIYGEMVALLCEDDNKDAALKLEKLWNKLAKAYTFSLYCAYPEYFFEEDPDYRIKISDCHSMTVASLVI